MARKAAVKSESSEFLILPGYEGKEVYTVKPEYKREQGAKFVLDETLSEKDKAFLYEVVGFEGIVKK